MMIHGQVDQTSSSTDGSRPGLWRTPDTIDRRSSKSTQIGLSNQMTGKLNPRWVETLMGLPVGWVMPSCASPVTIAPTNFASSATASFPPPPSELFKF